MIFVEECFPVLEDFLGSIGFSPSELVRTDAPRFLPGLTHFLYTFEYDDEHIPWVMSRVIYFVGEHFRQKYNGEWMMHRGEGVQGGFNYVVGEFENMDRGLYVDPRALAAEFVMEEKGRDLGKYIASAEVMLEASRRN